MQYGFIKGALVGTFLTMGTTLFTMQAMIKEAEQPTLHNFWQVDTSESRAALVESLPFVCFPQLAKSFNPQINENPFVCFPQLAKSFNPQINENHDDRRNINLKRDYQLSLLELLDLKLQHVLKGYSLEYENEISATDRGYIEESLNILVEAYYLKMIFTPNLTKVYIVGLPGDDNEPVQIYDAQGKLQWTLRSDSYIAYSSDGSGAVQVSDNDRIQVYDSEGNRKGICVNPFSNPPASWSKGSVYDSQGKLLALYEHQDAQWTLSSIGWNSILLRAVKELFERRNMRKISFLTLVKDAIKKRSQEQS